MKRAQMKLFLPAGMKRAQVKPLFLPADIHAVLLRLQVGEEVPSEIYIADYRNGTIPPWTVRDIEAHGILRILTVCDETEQQQATLFELGWCVACDVFTCSTKTLAGPFYRYSGPGCVHARNPLADIRQHARVIAERGAWSS